MSVPPASVAGLMARLGAMQNMKLIYTGILKMSEDNYNKMIERQKQRIKEAEADPRYNPWP